MLRSSAGRYRTRRGRRGEPSGSDRPAHRGPRCPSRTPPRRSRLRPGGLGYRDQPTRVSPGSYWCITGIRPPWWRATMLLKNTALKPYRTPEQNRGPRVTYPVRIAVQLHPQHAEYRQIRDAVHRLPRTSASTSSSTGITSTRCTANPTASTSSAGRCWPPGPSSRPNGSSWSAGDVQFLIATRSCWPTWPGRSTTSATGA